MSWISNVVWLILLCGSSFALAADELAVGEPDVGQQDRTPSETRPLDGSENSPPAAPSLVVVVGAAGTEEYGEQFRGWAERWEAAAEQGRAEYSAVGLAEPSESSDRDALRGELADHTGSSTPLWVVLIGHGTFDGRTARFNLRGDDVTAAELKGWLEPLDRPLAIINCTSSSGPFMAELSAPGRVVVTATRSGHEYNFARFGEYLSAAVADLQADLDKDQQVSLLEAFLFAAANLREFYASDARLMTEHALLDDNGDQQGTPADWFRGLRPAKAAKDGAAIDGSLAATWILVPSQHEQQLPPELRAERDRLEAELAELRARKAELPEDEYLDLLEPIAVALARLYKSAESQ